MLIRLIMAYRGSMSYLHIAQKNSIAKEVAAILSQGNRRTGQTLSKFNPVFHFERDGQPHTFSSVRGHIFDYELPIECKSWQAFDNSKILTRQVAMIRKPGPDMEDLLKNIQKIAIGKKQLILWLDCDREGQAIAFQVIEVVRRVNPHISIKRARFAAVTPSDIMRAWGGLILPNQLQADAVNYRIQMDFRMGCAFTRYQTVTFSKKYKFKEHSVISYGPCQMPTLGFVVQRYLQIKYFKPEKYWVIKATIILDQKTKVQLKWERTSTRDETQANLMFYTMFQQANRGEGRVMGRILARNKNQKKKYRPYPLTTVAFQKLATDKLRLSSAQAMKIAQKLYQMGFISYPRTQTNAFPPTINLTHLIERLKNCNSYQSYVQKLLQGRFMKPKVGNQSDQAHSPIHPVKPGDPHSMTPDQWKVYDLISRHFLACCSRDAVGIQSQIVAEIGQERFKASHITIKQKNYLQIYPFDKWVEGQFPGEIPEQFEAAVELNENKTKPPGYLTESDLIGQMQKNQIGTDATIHQHIETIQNRKYAFKTGNSFKPTNLGASLIVTYKSLGLHLEDCHIRRLIQQRMDKIAQGQIERDKAALDTLTQVIPLYEKLQQLQETWLEQMGNAMQEHKDLYQVQMEGSSNIPNQQSYQNRPRQNQQGESTFNSIMCYYCKEPGHLSSQCPTKDKQNRPNNQRFNPNNQRKQQPNKYSCFICGQEGHFAPACPNKNNPQKTNYKKNTNESKDKAPTCFTCGQEGHFAPACPNKNNPQKANYKKNTNDSKDKTPTCFTCGQVGHFAPACPKNNPQKTNYKKNTNQSKDKAFTCFICGQEGHFAPACPNKNNPQKANYKKSTNESKDKTPTCFTCGQVGHFSTNCPTKNPSTASNAYQKTCPTCGAQGRHPRGSNCPTIRKKTKNNSSSDNQNDF